MVELLGADHRAGQTNPERQDAGSARGELIEGTKLKTLTYRKELAAGGRKAIEASTDPMIVLARTIDAEGARAAQAFRKRSDRCRAHELREDRARAFRDAKAPRLYPDATFTLRLSYGAVKGYMENGKKVTPFTTLGGLYDRSAQFKAAVSVQPAAALDGEEVGGESERRHSTSSRPTTSSAATRVRRPSTRTANWSG